MGPEESLRAATVAEPLEAVISRIPGVRAARVVADGNRISEVHVIAGVDRSPKQLVRDVQSVAKAALDIDVDYRTVSIVQLEDPTDPVSPLAARPSARMPLLRVSGSTTGQLASIEVVLREDDLEVVGRARGAAALTPMLVARATLDAYEPRLQGSVAEVDAVDRLMIGGREVAVVVARLASSVGERIVTGSALVGADVNDAIARATLDAVNRVPA